MVQRVTATTSTERLLVLVRTALDEFDDRPLAVSIRRAVRIATLLGESHIAVRLSLELRNHGGDRGANAEDVRRLLADRSTWGEPEGPVETAFAEYMEDRRIAPGKVQGFSVTQLEFWDNYVTEAGLDTTEILESQMTDLEMLERIRHRTFTALCEWERRLTFGGTNEAIFTRYQRRVDRLLSEGAPHLVDQVNAVHRRMRDAASVDPAVAVEEELSQAVTTCRRILKAVIDHVLPGEHGVFSEDGHVLDNDKYRNRLREFTRRARAGEHLRDAVEAAVTGLSERFDALDGLASKGVHADVALEEAELCAISTFVVAGEVLRLNELMTEAAIET